MSVRQLISIYHGKIVIYRAIDNSCEDFENLFVGRKEDMPKGLLDLQVELFYAKAEDTIDIMVIS